MCQKCVKTFSNLKNTRVPKYEHELDFRVVLYPKSVHTFWLVRHVKHIQQAYSEWFAWNVSKDALEFFYILYSHIENNELNSLCCRACLLISCPLWLVDWAKGFLPPRFCIKSTVKNFWMVHRSLELSSCMLHCMV